MFVIDGLIFFKTLVIFPFRKFIFGKKNVDAHLKLISRITPVQIFEERKRKRGRHKSINIDVEII